MRLSLPRRAASTPVPVRSTCLRPVREGSLTAFQLHGVRRAGISDVPFARSRTRGRSAGGNRSTPASAGSSTTGRARTVAPITDNPAFEDGGSASDLGVPFTPRRIIWEPLRVRTARPGPFRLESSRPRPSRHPHSQVPTPPEETQGRSWAEREGLRPGGPWRDRRHPEGAPRVR